MMPPKKRSRAASRCKPVLGNVTNQVNAAQTELIIEDYKKNGMYVLLIVNLYNLNFHFLSKPIAMMAFEAAVC